MSQRTHKDWLEEGVVIGEEVDLLRIAEDVTIHAGSRIYGEETSIGPECVLGTEAPVTIDNCQLGRQVELKGGYCSGAVFFDGANVGSGAHIRAGTILEEEASGAHTVGFKQTILLPFTVTGSLINFCDVLLAGGTSRKNHSEVGSSYIHFNFTPHQDKATASLIGDVPNGVFLDQKPIFLGGQGGLVGPARIAYGSVVAAGGVCRQDILEEDQLHIPESLEAGTRSYNTGVYRNVDRLIRNNLSYIGNILALREWYRKVRSVFLCRDAFDQACLEGGLKNLDMVLTERIKRLSDLADKMEYSIQQLEKEADVPKEVVEAQKRFHQIWPKTGAGLSKPEIDQDEQLMVDFIERLEAIPLGSDYTQTIQSLDTETRQAGYNWLQSIVDHTVNMW